MLVVQLVIGYKALIKSHTNIKKKMDIKFWIFALLVLQIRKGKTQSEC